MIHEQKNLLVQLEKSENRSNHDENEIEKKLDESTRKIPMIYRERFERSVCSRQKENVIDENRRKILHELNQLSLNNDEFLNLIYRTILQWNSSTNETKRLVSRRS